MTTASSPTTNTSQLPYNLPPYTSFPPFYTLQPNHQTLTHQLTLWEQLIVLHCSKTSTYLINLSSPPSIFSNPILKRNLSTPNIRTVLDHLTTLDPPRTEWLPPASKGEKSSSCYVWWRSPGEWADAVYGWVEETGQKGAVLTVYELREGERSWKGMEEGMLRKVLQVLVKRGKAQLFSGVGDGGDGVKFF